MRDADALRTVVGLAVAQLFGGKSAPLKLCPVSGLALALLFNPVPGGVLAMRR